MNKKTLVFIAFFMMIFNINYTVKADAESPSSAGYEVVIKNKDGASLYGENSKIVTTIPYKTIVKVIYERTDDNNKRILYVRYEEYDGFMSYYVKDEDVIAKDYNLSNANKLEQKEEAIIFNKNGGILREGPSEVYDEIPKTIPYGTHITYQYVDSGYGLWAYVEYEDVKGWLWTFAGAKDTVHLDYGYVVPKTDYYLNILSITNDGKLYSSIYTEKNEVIDTIDVNTKLKCKYLYRNTCYVEYREQSGWIKIDNNFVYNDSYNENTKLLILTDAYLYKDSNFKNKFNFKIPTNTYFDEFYYEDYGDEPGLIGTFYVKYNNKYGWIDEYTIPVAFCGYHETENTHKAMNIYKSPNNNSEILSIIPSDSKIIKQCYANIYENDDYHSWKYVEYDGINGWLNEDELYNDEEEDQESNENSNNKPNNNDEKEENKWYKRLTPMQFSLLCIGSALILTLTAIVIIVLIKKKRKKQSKENNKKIDKEQKENKDNKSEEKTIDTIKNEIKLEDKITETELSKKQSQENTDNKN